MKKITLLLSFLTVFASKSYAQFPQGFEDAAFPPAGWATFIGTNGLGTAQNWMRTTDYTFTGDGAAYVRWDNSSAGSPKEDWLVTPQFTVTEAAPAMTFIHSQGYTAEYNTTYSIRVSTTSQTSHAAFTSILEMDEDDVPLEYGPKLIDLSDYIGQQIYVAFVMTNDDGDNWYIDDVALTSLSEAPQCASGPFPANAAVDVPVGVVTFTWEAPSTGDAPTSYDLFAGNAPGQVNQFIANVTENSIELNITGYNALIYWKIVPKNAAGSATGCAEWSFTTQASPGYCVSAPNGQYPGGAEGYDAENCDGVASNVVTESGWAGEYSLVNVVEGIPYTFSSGSTDFITIASMDDVPFVYGETPLTWVSTVTGPIKFFSHVDDQCGAENVNRVRSFICGTPTEDLPDYVNLQFPSAIEINQGGSDVVYGQVYEAGLTDVEPGLSGQAAGIAMWVGVSTENTDPATWTEDSWVQGEFNAMATGNNDEYMAAIGQGLEPGTYYYATRFRLLEGAYVYGGTDGTNGNFWDGTTYNSGVMNISPAAAPNNDECISAIALTPANNYSLGAITTTNLGATSPDGLEPSCQDIAGENVWYTVVVPASGSITIQTGEAEGSAFNDSVMTVYSGTCGELTEIGCNDDTDGLFSVVSLSAQTPGSTLYISVWRYNSEFASGEPGEFQISAFDASLSTQGFNSDSFSFYPNPVKDVLTFSYSEKISDVKFYNMIGQEVFSQSTDATNVAVDMSTFAAGAYVVKVTSEGLSKTVKVVKQ